MLVLLCQASVGGCCPCIAPVPSPARRPPRAAIGPRFPAHLVATTNPRADTARHGDPAAWRYMACHHPPSTPALSLRHTCHNSHNLYYSTFSSDNIKYYTSATRRPWYLNWTVFVAKYFHHIANCGLQAALYSAVQKKVISPLRRVPPPPPAVRGVRGANIEHQQSAN